MNASKQKQKKYQFSSLKKKVDALKALWNSRTNYIWHFLIKLFQFGKTGSIGRTRISLGNLIIKHHFQNRSQPRFEWPFHFCCLIVQFTFLLTKEMNWFKKKMEVKRENVNLSLNKFQDLLQEIIRNYMLVFPTFINSSMNIRDIRKDLSGLRSNSVLNMILAMKTYTFGAQFAVAS